MHTVLARCVWPVYNIGAMATTYNLDPLASHPDNARSPIGSVFSAAAPFSEEATEGKLSPAHPQAYDCFVSVGVAAAAANKLQAEAGGSWWVRVTKSDLFMVWRA